MFSEKSNLVDRIHSALNTKWYKKSIDIFDLPEKKELEEHRHLTGQNYFVDSNSAVAVEKLEERIAVLEKQYDQLLYFINFLVDNFPNLVINIIQADHEKKETVSHKESTNEHTDPWLKSDCCQSKGEPCPTRRERDVLELLEKGYCAKEIAHQLFISETTVITHKKNLKEKFNARNTVELISKAHLHYPGKNT